MALFNQHWIGMDGKPVTGRVPTQMFVVNGQKLTAQQQGAVFHAYKLFCDAVQFSANPGGYHSQSRRLPDGTQIRMESNGGVHRVFVHPTDTQGGTKIPHGFTVVTPWSEPTLYKHMYGPSDSGAFLDVWEVFKGDVPQAKNGTLGAYNSVYRSGDEWELTYPMVMSLTGSGMVRLWTYAAAAAAWAPESTEGMYPVNLEYPQGAKEATTYRGLQVKEFGFVKENEVYSRKGELAYTMEDAEPITVFGEETITYLPPTATGDGTRLMLNAYRSYSMYSADAVKYKFWHEVLSRKGPTEYEVDARESVSFVSPLPVYDVHAESTGGIGEEPQNKLYYKVYTVKERTGMGAAHVILHGETYLHYEHLGYRTGSSGISSRMLDIAPYMVLQTPGYTDIFSPVEVKTELPNLIVVPGINAPEYVSLKNDGKYEVTGRFRAGQSVWTTDPIPELAEMEYVIGERFARATLDRRDSQYVVQGEPKIDLSVGWVSEQSGYRLLEGESLGELKGHKYEDSELKRSNVDAIYEAGDFVLDDPLPEWETVPLYPGRTTTTANIVHSVVEDGHGGYIVDITENGNLLQLIETNNVIEKYRAIRAEFNNEERKFNQETIPPRCTGMFDFTSRHIIDYDHRARFLMAVTVRVECRGALWENGPDYLGQIIKVADPTYVVTIGLEWIWCPSESEGGTPKYLTGGKELTKVGFLMPAFCFDRITKYNPYAWPADYGEEGKMTFYMPPKVTLPPHYFSGLKPVSTPQGLNDSLASQDFSKSPHTAPRGMFFSTLEDDRVRPHEGVVPGMLYARTFKLSDIYDGLWLLPRLCIDAPLNNFRPPDGDYELWYYCPELKEIIFGKTFHIELRDGKELSWSDDIPEKETEGEKKTRPKFDERKDIKVYVI